MKSFVMKTIYQNIFSNQFLDVFSRETCCATSLTTCTNCPVTDNIYVLRPSFIPSENWVILYQGVISFFCTQLKTKVYLYKV